MQTARRSALAMDPAETMVSAVSPVAANPIVNGVIFADNDPMLRGILRSVLTHAGQQVFLAADGAEAVDLAQRFVARLVLLDIHMPRVDGFTACRTIRNLPGYDTNPILMLTADDRAATRERAERLGANDVFTKPIHMDLLLQRLGTYIRLPPTLMDGQAAGLNVILGAGDPAGARIWGAQGNLKPVPQGLSSREGTVGPVLRVAHDSGTRRPGGSRPESGPKVPR